MINIYTIVWDEEFMLPHFLKHYEKFADKIFIIDDHSTDKTAELAKAHPKVEYYLYGFQGWNEKEVNDTFYSFYKSNPSDWAVVVDCDEFVDLGSLGPLGVYRVQAFMMIGETGKLEDCRPIRWKPFDKPILFSPEFDIKFKDGRHECNVSSEPGPFMYHYKYPSREYYLQRSLDTYPRIMDAKQMSYRIKRGLTWYDEHA